MRTRFAIWRARRSARIISRYACQQVDACVDGIRVGMFRNGDEVGR